MHENCCYRRNAKIPSLSLMVVYGYSFAIVHPSCAGYSCDEFKNVVYKHTHARFGVDGWWWW